MSGALLQRERCSPPAVILLPAPGAAQFGNAFRVWSGRGIGQRPKRPPLSAWAAGKPPMAVFQPLVIKMQGVSGIVARAQSKTVHFACAPGTAATCSFGAPGTAGKSSIDVPLTTEGIASSGPLQLSGPAGAYGVTATVETFRPLDFTLTVERYPIPTIISFTGGADQSLAVGANGFTVFAPITVTLTSTADGKPVANAPVLWQCIQPAGTKFGCQLNRENPINLTTTTNAQGVAMLNQENGGSVQFYGPGSFRIAAGNPSAQTNATSLVATGSATPPPTAGAPSGATPPPLPFTIRIAAGGNQTVTRAGTAPAGGTAEFAPFTVVFTDKSDGKPYAGKPVVFVCHTPVGGACAINSSVPATTASLVTDANGSVTLALRNGKSLDASGVAGTYPLFASVGGVTISFPFIVK